MKSFLLYIKKILPKKILDKMRPAYHYTLSFLSAVFYSWPSNKMIVIGITGTSGKTSSVYLMAKILNASGYKAGYTSTAMFGDGDKEWLNDKKMTMLGPFFTQRILKRMYKNNCKYAIVETTSEGIKQFRHRFINYDTLVFTGLYPEHIESHGGFDNYKEAKGELFYHLKRCSPKYLNDKNEVVKARNNLSKIDFNRLKKTVIINADDDHASYFSSFWSEEKFFYSEGFRDDLEFPAIFYENIDVDISGTSFSFIFSENEKIERRDLKLKLWGDFNVLNLMPSLSLPFIFNIDLDKVLAEAEKVKGIPGRLEMLDLGQKFLTIVDYAYEPVALEKAYKAILFLREKLLDAEYQGRIIHILGSAGGGRDKDRRHKLGEIAAKRADIVIISNEDPYDENPLDIINQVASGAKSLGKLEGSNLFRILDRREAIKKALSLAKEGDLLFVTGKGCEQAICLADGKKMPWDDRIVIKEEIIKMMDS
jgi:UDP-N-acetylmuramoyl-L-alanyl-D-glutamate--2,6-diaminopimelate ligase